MPASHGFGHDGAFCVSWTIRSRKRRKGKLQPGCEASGFFASGFGVPAFQ
jgi:hypothetical protein